MIKLICLFKRFVERFFGLGVRAFLIVIIAQGFHSHFDTFLESGRCESFIQPRGFKNQRIAGNHRVDDNAPKLDIVIKVMALLFTIVDIGRRFGNQAIQT